MKRNITPEEEARLEAFIRLENNPKVQIRNNWLLAGFHSFHQQQDYHAYFDEEWNDDGVVKRFPHTSFADLHQIIRDGKSMFGKGFDFDADHLRLALALLGTFPYYVIRYIK